MSKVAVGGARWALLDQAVVSAANFLGGILVARSLGAQGLAMYSLAITTVFGIFTVHRALVVQPLNILGVQEPEARRWGRFGNMMVAQRVVLPAVALLYAVIGMYFFRNPGLILGGCVYVAVFCLQELVRRYHYTGGDISKAVPGDVLAYVGQLVFVATAWGMGWLTLDNVLWWMSAPLALATVWMYGGVVRLGHGPASPDTPAPSTEMREHWVHARWVVMSQVIWIGATQLIPFQLSLFGKPSDVAAFHAANTLMNALNILRLTMGNYLPTKAAAILAHQGKADLRAYLLKVGAAVVAFASVGWLVTWLIGEWVVSLVFGGKYVQAGEILPTLAAVNLFALLALVCAAGAQILGIARVMFVSNLVAMVLCLALGPFLVAHAGLWGAVAISAIGLLLPTVMQGVRVLQALKV